MCELISLSVLQESAESVLFRVTPSTATFSTSSPIRCSEAKSALFANIPFCPAEQLLEQYKECEVQKMETERTLTAEFQNFQKIAKTVPALSNVGKTLEKLELSNLTEEAATENIALHATEVIIP